ncbi:enoyl-CoA hydratase/isomerase family protein [Lutimaribacter saemankumensis]|uniref:Enoyl-CoA hydratase n=1 Tax=Lutimaribacter saemankumensis TaxID=490829 RepID=A0A1G8SFN4_9RHOB|nr:enoyl-CoA hydratase/isomerase family protein [Lutimaribacter saemankumensis]SDJ27575.1 enoyl-CoA hydratase [Lutimaribacter saemankumensis]
MSGGQAVLTVNGAIAEIVFHNPDQGFMDRAMEADLLKAIEQIAGDPSIRVCVLSGAEPGVFIRHYDLKVLAPQAAQMAAREMVFTTDRPVPEAPIHIAMRLMEGSDTIFIAAMTGTAMGGGFELALACDLRIVQAGDHEYGLPEINLGILPGAGGTQRLPQIVGQSRALHMTLTGDTLSPDEMVAAGLASASVADARAEALALAQRMAGKPARAASHIKRLVRQAMSAGPEAFADERTLFCDLMVQPDANRLLTEGAEGARRITDEP